MSQFAPIVLFTYNRLEETKQTLKALQKNLLAKESELFIFSDGPKDEKGIPKIQEVRDYLKTIEGFKKVTIKESKVNIGLANSIISGVSEIIEEYGSVIVLEDDLITSPNFLNFMNRSLDFYKTHENIYMINGYSLKIDNAEDNEIYFHRRACSWGWATWDNRWERSYFDKPELREIINKAPHIMQNFKDHCGGDVKKMLLDSLSGKNNSWYIRWVFYNFLIGKTSVFPVLSKVRNIGFNENGTHCTGITVYDSKFDHLSKLNFDFSNVYVFKEDDYSYLKFFSMKYKIEYRLKLLLYRRGRRELFSEIKNKIQ